MPALHFVTCVSQPAVLAKRLLASPCLAERRYPLSIHGGARSAAEAINHELAQQPAACWLVWVHQDVYLPAGWDQTFIAALATAKQQFAQLAVAGVYGIAAGACDASNTRRAGHVLDRGQLLQEPVDLPCLASSLDELLIAVRVDAGLRADPDLGFDFYGTDLCLAAAQKGLQAVVLDACCEHWADTPHAGFSPALLERIRHSGSHFEQKWAAALPLTTPCLTIAQAGDVARCCEALSRT